MSKILKIHQGKPFAYHWDRPLYNGHFALPDIAGSKEVVESSFNLRTREEYGLLKVRFRTVLRVDPSAQEGKCLVVSSRTSDQELQHYARVIDHQIKN